MDKFHQEFDRNAKEILDPVREALIESVESCTKPEIIGQILMNFLGDGNDKGHFSADEKTFFVHMADHMGPDWAQALYHAAVFITKGA